MSHVLSPRLRRRGSLGRAALGASRGRSPRSTADFVQHFSRRGPASFPLYWFPGGGTVTTVPELGGSGQQKSVPRLESRSLRSRYCQCDAFSEDPESGEGAGWGVGGNPSLLLKLLVAPGL